MGTRSSVAQGGTRSSVAQDGIYIYIYIYINTAAAAATATVCIIIYVCIYVCIYCRRPGRICIGIRTECESPRGPNLYRINDRICVRLGTEFV